MKKDSPAAYNDVKYIMNIALKKPGLKYELKTGGRATNFKQRCNMYRNMLRKMQQEQSGNIPGFRAETAYDILIIRQTDSDGNSTRSGKFLLFEHHAAEGILTDPETGEKINIEVEGLNPLIKDE